MTNRIQRLCPTYVLKKSQTKGQAHFIVVYQHFLQFDGCVTSVNDIVDSEEVFKEYVMFLR